MIYRKGNTMKTLLFVIIAACFLFTGCVGMPKLFAPVEPYCTPEEQKDSLIYKYLNPGDANFTLKLGVAATLDKHPEKADDIKKALIALKTAVESGISYAAFAEQVEREFGLLTMVVLDEAFTKFKTVRLPLNVCDKRLALGAIDNMLKIVALVH